jgi:hypothetical protein
MDDVYSRSPQDLSDFSRPHTLLLVWGKLLQLFSCLSPPLTRFFFRSFSVFLIPNGNATLCCPCSSPSMVLICW